MLSLSLSEAYNKTYKQTFLIQNVSSRNYQVGPFLTHLQIIAAQEKVCSCFIINSTVANGAT